MSSLSSELFILRKRPATWVISAVLILSVVLFGYFLSYQIVLGQRMMGAGEETDLPGPTAEETLLPPLLPENVLSNVLLFFSGGAGAAALVLGALAMGSEYGWETLKTLLVKPPGRVRAFLEKVLAVYFVLAILAVSLLAAGALSSYIIAVLEDTPTNWPSLSEFVRALGATWLILGAYSSIGIFFATLFRSASLAIGAGLAYALVLEFFVLAVQTANSTIQALQDALLGQASTSLAESFGDSSQVSGNSTHAALVLVMYMIVSILLGSYLFRQRDVT